MGIETSHSEQELIRRFNTGDKDAFVAVYERYYPLVVVFAKRYVGNEYAADITAEVFVRLWNQQSVFESAKHLRSSLQLTARNLCIDQLRAQQVESKHQNNLRYLQAHYDPADYQVETVRAQVYSLIVDEINRLPPYLKDVFRLAYIEGLSNAEIAERLNLKDASVRTKKSQALDILRSKLSKMEFALLLTGLLRHFQD